MDMNNRRYINSNVNNSYLRKSQHKRDTGVTNKKLPTKNGEESSLVDKVIEPLARRSQISNLELLKDLDEVIDFIRHKQLSFKAPQQSMT